MKILRLVNINEHYLNEFYSEKKYLLEKNYEEHKKEFYEDAFGWADFWIKPFFKLGCHYSEVIINNPYLLKSWSDSMDLPYEGEKNAVIKQVEKLRPDIIWYCATDRFLLDEIKNKFSFVKLFIAYAGSAINDTGVYDKVDFVFTCAPESLDYFKEKGIKAHLLSHAFSEKVYERLEKKEKQYDVSFIGRILRGDDFHINREEDLLKIIDKISLSIFSPAYGYGLKDDVKICFVRAIYAMRKVLEQAGISDDKLNKIPLIEKCARYKSMPLMPLNKKIKPLLKKEVYGMKMYNVINESKICLNIHADSSPKKSSNMRLFEVTGAGSCLLTDWRDNISEFFKVDEEVVVYKSVEECIEKAKWLLENDSERQKISDSGQKRTLKEHNFFNRAEDFMKIVRQYI